MENSDKFLEYYCKIDNYLKKIGNYDSYVPFSQKVKDSKLNVVKAFKDELLTFGNLRNAIVHSPKLGNEVIAEPHERTVFRIEELYQKISNPIKVIPKFQSEVLGTKEDDFINDILLKMKQFSFSQFPIFDTNGRVCELINTNTISRWLSYQLEQQGTIMVEHVKVKDLIPEIEFKLNFKFIARNASVYDAYDLFIKHINNEKRNLDVLFITNSGKPEEHILGLITIEDIANLV